jgi:predicted nucleic acid-binding protein
VEGGSLAIKLPESALLDSSVILIYYKPDLTQLQVQEAVSSFYDMDIRIVQISQEVIKQAIHFAYFQDITVYDAAFVAMADYLKIPFITSDEKLVQKIGKFSYVRHISDLLSG